jgi:hypothetical protein
VIWNPLGHAFAEQARVGLEPVSQLGRLGEQIQGLHRGPDDRRGDGVREQVGPAPLAEHVDDLLPAAGVAAAGAAQRLAQRAGEDVDAVHHVVVLVRAPAGLAHEADGVGVVDDHQGVVLVGQIADLHAGWR